MKSPSTKKYAHAFGTTGGTTLTDEGLLRLLVCPKSGGKLKLESGRLVCEKTGTSYPICDGIPIMLSDEDLNKSHKK
ncbi:MAG: hypothetical protein LBO73_03815 [Holosporaceae bacterium]|jgi:uncharacterized protein YbaR (Trm112 family)|nr:hypothetical protein [Holosporaceae bacterium]